MKLILSVTRELAIITSSLIVIAVLFAGCSSSATSDTPSNNSNSQEEVLNNPPDPIRKSTGDLLSLSIEESGIVDHYIEMAADEIKVHFKAPSIQTDADVLLEWTYIWTTVALQSTQSTVTIVQYVEDVPVIQAMANRVNIMKLISEEISFPDFADTTATSLPTSEWKCSAGSVLIDGTCY